MRIWVIDNLATVPRNGYFGTRLTFIGQFAKFVLLVHINCYFLASGQNSDISFRFCDPDFLVENNNLAIRRLLRCCFYCTHRKSAAFLFSVYIWPGYLECASHIADIIKIIFYQVWSWSVLSRLVTFYCWYVTSCCDLDLWTFNLECL